ncbi:Glycosyl hydrolases family 43 [Geosmithia morbida]|uniref:Glycosyl hydrolases family 43 n=1 Tax=Geosmithia morbida TaxID=1094350 RepID=A0A9P4YNP7_9HYPO|nr:Glycosyl hydrolases family 43 [Geosmithia morbida]KAF4119925.1 Glycosyl hydrolases family 43 [Geosmithia morbida]
MKLLTAALGFLTLVLPVALASPPTHYDNTLNPPRADPHILKHTDGWYYFVATVAEFDRVIIRRALTIQELQKAEETTMFQEYESGRGSGEVWAPKLHYIDGKWYVYVVLGLAKEWYFRAAVLEGRGDNPIEAEWTDLGDIQTDWDTFSLDMTTFEAGGTRYAYEDLMDMAAWTKSQEPVFKSNAETVQYGPVHDCFTLSEDGLSDVMVYHNRWYKDIDGDPLDDPNHRTRVQKVYWRADGSPDFRIPVPEGRTPARLRLAADEDAVYYVHGTSKGEALNAVDEAGRPSLAEAQFRIVRPGLAGSGTADDGSDGFKGDASFEQQDCLSDPEGVLFRVASGEKHVRFSSDSALVVGDVAGGQEGQSKFFLE